MESPEGGEQPRQEETIQMEGGANMRRTKVELEAEEDEYEPSTKADTATAEMQGTATGPNGKTLTPSGMTEASTGQ